MTQKHSENELLFIFFTQEITAALVSDLYFFKNISNSYNSQNLVVSSHTFHKQVSGVSQWFFFISCLPFPFIQFH